MNCLDEQYVTRVVKNALREDIGKRDITTRYFLPDGVSCRAAIIAKEKGVVCGLDIAKRVFQCLDRRITFFCLAKDGKDVRRGEVLARLRGPAAGILTGERVALNFLGLLCGIATRTRRFLRLLGPHNVRLMDTRKTIPGLRKLEKYAVRVGGGFNHRQRLDDMFLVKDNHIAIRNRTRRSDLGGVIDSLRRKSARKRMIEVEVGSLKEFYRVLEAGPDIIMLDNMPPSEIRKAVHFKERFPSPRIRRIKIEASGDINSSNIRSYAACGVDFISLGTLTRDVESLDLSLEIN
ncbi:MAG: carboxylating nicotinate-nucleotide diphosphorylase [Candidatus Omnitrophota bacterium]